MFKAVNKRHMRSVLGNIDVVVQLYFSNFKMVLPGQTFIANKEEILTLFRLATLFGDI